jgi:hypothetical protein
MSHLTDYRISVPTLEPRCIREAMAAVLDRTLIEQAASKFVSSLTPDAIKAFNGRLERGLELAKSGAVQPLPEPKHPRRFLVRSSDGSQNYVVDLDTKTCECPDSLKGKTCKHRIAAYYIEQANQMAVIMVAPKAPAPVAMAAPKPQPSAVPPIQPAAPKPQPAAVAPVQPTQAPKPVVTAIPTKEVPKSDPATPEVAPTKTREQKLLEELGYTPEPPRKVKEEPRSQKQGIMLGTLYRRYLCGLDLGEKVIQVTIREIAKEAVFSNPFLPVEELWCLWVNGMPGGLPNGILLDAQGEDDLIAIFGKVCLDDIKGKLIVVYAKQASIRFRRTL